MAKMLIQIILLLLSISFKRASYENVAAHQCDSFSIKYTVEEMPFIIANKKPPYEILQLHDANRKLTKTTVKRMFVEPKAYEQSLTTFYRREIDQAQYKISNDGGCLKLDEDFNLDLLASSLGQMKKPISSSELVRRFYPDLEYINKHNDSNRMGKEKLRIRDLEKYPDLKKELSLDDRFDLRNEEWTLIWAQEYELHFAQGRKWPNINRNEHSFLDQFAHKIFIWGPDDMIAYNMSIIALDCYGFNPSQEDPFHLDIHKLGCKQMHHDPSIGDHFLQEWSKKIPIASSELVFETHSSKFQLDFTSKLVQISWLKSGNKFIIDFSSNPEIIYHLHDGGNSTGRCNLMSFGDIIQTDQGDSSQFQRLTHSDTSSSLGRWRVLFGDIVDGRYLGIKRCDRTQRLVHELVLTIRSGRAGLISLALRSGRSQSSEIQELKIQFALKWQCLDLYAPQSVCDPGESGPEIVSINDAEVFNAQWNWPELEKRQELARRWDCPFREKASLSARLEWDQMIVESNGQIGCRYSDLENQLTRLLRETINQESGDAGQIQLLAACRHSELIMGLDQILLNFHMFQRPDESSFGFHLLELEDHGFSEASSLLESIEAESELECLAKASSLFADEPSVWVSFYLSGQMTYCKLYKSPPVRMRASNGESVYKRYGKTEMPPTSAFATLDEVKLNSIKDDFSKKIQQQMNQICIGKSTLVRNLSLKSVGPLESSESFTLHFKIENPIMSGSKITGSSEPVSATFEQCSRSCEQEGSKCLTFSHCRATNSCRRSRLRLDLLHPFDGDKEEANDQRVSDEDCTIYSRDMNSHFQRDTSSFLTQPTQLNEPSQVRNESDIKTSDECARSCFAMDWCEQFIFCHEESATLCSLASPGRLALGVGSDPSACIHYHKRASSFYLPVFVDTNPIDWNSLETSHSLIDGLDAAACAQQCEIMPNCKSFDSCRIQENVPKGHLEWQCTLVSGTISSGSSAISPPLAQWGGSGLEHSCMHYEREQPKPAIQPESQPLANSGGLSNDGDRGSGFLVLTILCFMVIGLVLGIRLEQVYSTRAAREARVQSDTVT